MAPWLACGCGIGIVDNQSGGSDHLPTVGAGPYGKLPIDRDTPADEPFAISAFPSALGDPAALEREDGGYRLWFGRVANLSEVSEIWYAELPDITELPDLAPEPALGADAPWEESWVAEPSVVRVDSEHLVMFYRGGVTTPGIGRADSSDNGVTWTKHAGNPLLLGHAQPSAIYYVGDDGARAFALYTVRSDAPGIFRASSSDGTNFAPGDDPVLAPRWADPEAFDRHAVFNPCVTWRVTASGEPQYGLYFNALDSSDPDASATVGWAGSADGVQWYRFASPDLPILAPGGPSEYSPSVLLEPDRGIMFYSEPNRGVPAIAVAMHP